MAPNSICKPIFCMTCQRPSCGQVRRTSVRKRKSFSDRPATFAAGRRYQCVSSLRRTIVFPLEFQRRIALARLKTDVHVICGGHFVALSNAEGLLEQFLRFERKSVDRGVVGYNVQIAVEANHHLIVMHEVTNDGTDQ